MVTPNSFVGGGGGGGGGEGGGSSLWLPMKPLICSNPTDTEGRRFKWTEPF